MNYKKELYHPRTDALSLISSLKTLGYKKFLVEIKKVKSHPVVKSYVEGNLFPKELSKLNTTGKKYISKNIGGELGWLVYSIKKYHKKINNFLVLKNQFEKQILLSSFDGAVLTIDRIEKEICYSFWSVENKFSLLERKYGTERNWEFLNELNEKTGGDNLSLFYLELFSKKAEKKLSFARYKRSLNYDLSNLDRDLQEYLYYKFGYFFNDKYTHFDYFLLREGAFSLVDRYELTINILCELISDKEHLEYNTSIEVLKDLNKVIKDSRITRMLEYSGVFDISEENIPKEIISYFEDYSKGNYKSCFKLFPNLVEKYPNCIEIYEPFIKSIIELDEVLPEIEVSKEINGVIKNLYSIYTFNDDFDFSLENLQKKIITFSSLPFYKQLLGLVSFYTLIKTSSKAIPNQIFFNSIFSNPLLYILNSDRATTNSSDSLMFKINFSIASSSSDFISFSSSLVPEKKNQLYEIRRLFYNKEFSKCLTEIKSYSQRTDLKPFDLNEIFNHTYNCHIEKKEFDFAVKILSNQLMQRKNFCSKINLDFLLNEIVESDFKGVSGSFELVLFCHYANASSYLQFVALDELFISLNVEYPHQLLDYIDDVNRRKIVYILEEVCNVDVLGNFLVYETRTEVVKERENILVDLIEMIPEKQGDFISEIAKLKNSEIVKNVIKEVNDGRIYINIKSLDQSQKGDFENSYQRLLSLLEYTKSNALYFADVNGKIEKLYLDFSSQEELRKDAAFLACKSFVNEITNNFLYSKEYGLDGCLSTRIRHGSLENNIRGTIERFGIISKKTNDKYQEVDFWIANGSHLTESINSQIQNHLIEFSKQIDDLIRDLLSEKVQIYSFKSLDKEDALFNYYFQDDYHWLLYNDLKEADYDYEAFVSYIFDILKIYTNKILKGSRDYFKTTVKDTLIYFLEELTGKINETLGHHSYPQLLNNIKSAITQIQNEIDDNISEWFKLSEDTFQNLLGFTSIVNTSVSLTSNNINEFKPTVICDNDIGVYGYLHYIFIFRILFDNIIKHSKLAPSEIDTTVNANYDEESNMMRISVKNKLNDCIDINDLEKQMELVEQNWSTKSPRQEVINTEGGSGFEKIKRILTYDVNSSNHSFNSKIEDKYLEIFINIPMTILKPK